MTTDQQIKTIEALMQYDRLMTALGRQIEAGQAPSLKKAIMETKPNWRIVHESNDAIIIVDQLGRTIAELPIDTTCEKSQLANAELIIKAVENFGPLLAACKALCDKQAQQRSHVNNTQWWQARQAIAQAEGK